MNALLGLFGLEWTHQNFILQGSLLCSLITNIFFDELLKTLQLIIRIIKLLLQPLTYTR